MERSDTDIKMSSAIAKTAADTNSEDAEFEARVDEALRSLSGRFVREFELQRGQRKNLSQIPLGLKGGWTLQEGDDEGTQERKCFDWKLVTEALLDPEENDEDDPESVQYIREVLLMAHITEERYPAAVTIGGTNWSGSSLLGISTKEFQDCRRLFAYTYTMKKDGIEPTYAPSTLAAMDPGCYLFAPSREKLEKLILNAMAI